MSSWTHRLDTRYSRATSALLLPCSLTAATTTRPTDTPHLPKSRCERCPETGVNYVVEPDTAAPTLPGSGPEACRYHGPMPKLTFPDGRVVDLPDGEPIGSVLPSAAVAARLDGRLVDLAFVPQADAPVTPLLPGEQDGLHVLRHSAAHVMAQAVCDLFPDAKYALGPPIEDGFYYDFELRENLTPEDLPKIEARMAEISSE